MTRISNNVAKKWALTMRISTEENRKSQGHWWLQIFVQVQATETCFMSIDEIARFFPSPRPHNIITEGEIGIFLSLRNMKKIWRNMKEYEEIWRNYEGYMKNMKRYEENMKELWRNIKKIWRKYEELWRNYSPHIWTLRLRKIPSSPVRWGGGGGERKDMKHVKCFYSL